MLQGGSHFVCSSVIKLCIIMRILLGVLQNIVAVTVVTERFNSASSSDKGRQLTKYCD